MPREAHDIKQAGGAVAAVRLARNIQVGLGRHLCTAAASYGAIPIFSPVGAPTGNPQARDRTP